MCTPLICHSFSCTHTHIHRVDRRQLANGATLRFSPRSRISFQCSESTICIWCFSISFLFGVFHLFYGLRINRVCKLQASCLYVAQSTRTFNFHLILYRNLSIFLSFPIAAARPTVHYERNITFCIGKDIIIELNSIEFQIEGCTIFGYELEFSRHLHVRWVLFSKINSNNCNLLCHTQQQR